MLARAAILPGHLINVEISTRQWEAIDIAPSFIEPQTIKASFSEIKRQPNKGITARIVDNRHHYQSFSDMQLRRETIFGC